ncbi:MAG: hypothetical protein R3B36_04695 [Polyangiaceae bacterium]
MRRTSTASALTAALVLGAGIFLAPGAARAQKSAFIDPDRSADEDTKKPWTVGAIFETHRLVRQEDLNGAARNKALNYLYLYAGLDLSKYDTVQLRGGVYQRFLADETETGVRADDLSAAYIRQIPLPAKLDLRLTGSLLAPLSYQSQKQMGLITVPRLTASLERQLGDFSVSLRGSGAYYIVRYKQEAGGGANARASTVVGLNAEYTVPIHKPLQFGMNLMTGWYWLYDAADGNNSTLRDQFQNAPVTPARDPQFTEPPANQTYGGEIYARYTLPELLKARSDVTLSFAQGDSTLGYPGVIHDGRTHLYWMFRRSAQVYLALGVRY